ncbi:MAG: glycosyltransferase family 4 protein [Planctomycetota bacterium]
MKVAFVTWKFPALSNTFILNEIVEVKKRGVDVVIYSIDRSDDETVHCDVERHGLLERTFFFDDFVPEAARTKAGQEAPSPYDAYRVDWLRHRVHGFEAMAQHMLDTGVDVVHGCFANNSGTVAMVAARLAGLPYTFECHAFDLFCDFKFSDEKLAEAARIFSISDYNRRYMAGELGCDETKIPIRRVPILKEFCDEIDAGVEGARDPGLVVSVARLAEIKGYDVALRAFQKVAAEHPEARYVIVGEGEDREALVALRDELGLQDRVEFRGVLQNREALRLVRSAQAFVLPSRIGSNGDRDGIPTSMIEAMYLRTPCISTRVSGIPELVSDGQDGLLAEPEDVDTVAAHWSRLLSNRDFRRELGERARAKVGRDFDCDRNIDVLIEHWTQIKDDRREPQLPAQPVGSGRGFWSSLRQKLGL